MISKAMFCDGSASRGDGREKGPESQLPNGKDAAWSLSKRGETRYSI